MISSLYLLINGNYVTNAMFPECTKTKKEKLHTPHMERSDSTVFAENEGMEGVASRIHYDHTVELPILYPPVFWSEKMSKQKKKQQPGEDLLQTAYWVNTPLQIPPQQWVKIPLRTATEDDLQTAQPTQHIDQTKLSSGLKKGSTKLNELSMSEATKGSPRLSTSSSSSSSSSSLASSTASSSSSSSSSLISTHNN